MEQWLILSMFLTKKGKKQNVWANNQEVAINYIVLDETSLRLKKEGEKKENQQQKHTQHGIKGAKS